MEKRAHGLYRVSLPTGLEITGTLSHTNSLIIVAITWTKSHWEELAKFVNIWLVTLPSRDHPENRGKGHFKCQRHWTRVHKNVHEIQIALWERWIKWTEMGEERGKIATYQFLMSVQKIYQKAPVNPWRISPTEPFWQNVTVTQRHLEDVHRSSVPLMS
jgi:hypothetical protein